MLAVQIFILVLLLTGGFYVSRFLFWLLFMKDAPSYDEQENFYFDYQENK
ncbi:hypothetical protein [Nafulsella turpanensis]|nr:hypothetical protein [Nafulsella turpanensis]